MTIQRFFLLSIFFYISLCNIAAQDITIYGTIIDENYKPISFVSVYEEGTSNATLSNDDGKFELTISTNSTLIFQYLGYYTKKIEDLNKDTDGLTVQLSPSIFELSAVEVTADQEDPAYPIIRKAIQNRPSNYDATKNYEAELYVKGMVKILDSPTTFMGQEIGNLEGILDSSQQGIFYLSETKSIIAQKDGMYKEKLISSKLSGDDNGIGFNQFLNNRISFYSSSIPFIREMIGPLDDKALEYYKYQLLSTSVDNNGRLIHTIKCIPKSSYRPCFTGEITILDEGYKIYSLDLAVSGLVLKNPIFDTVRINQIHTDIGEDKWRMITQHIQADLKFFAFKAKGDFIGVFSNYRQEFTLDFEKDTEVIFEAPSSAIKNDEGYWSSNRPIPLTEEEQEDYKRKDSLQILWNSKEYLDSLDQAENKLKWRNLLFGYSYQNSHKKSTWRIMSPLLTLNFNPAEGLNTSLNLIYQQRIDDNKNFRLKADAGYGFLDKRWKPLLSAAYQYDKKSLSSLYMGIGRTVADFSDFQIMAEISNSWHSLVFKNNYLKLHQLDQVYFGWKSEVLNGLLVNISLQHEQRQLMDNNTNYSIRLQDEEYEPNRPTTPFSSLTYTQKTSAKTEFTWNPNQKVIKYPNNIIRAKSGAPTYSLSMEYAPRLNSKSAEFMKIDIGIRDNYIKLGKQPFLSTNIEAGYFILNNGVEFMDFNHFIGQEVIPRYMSKYQDTYKLLPYYELDSTDPYISTFNQIHLNGYILEKVPFFNRLGWKLIFNLATLTRSDIQYFEPGIGIGGIKYQGLDVCRIDYYWGIDQSGYRNQGFRFGFVNIFGNN